MVSTIEVLVAQNGAGLSVFGFGLSRMFRCVFRADFTRLQSLAYTAGKQVRPPRRDSAIGASIDEAHTRQAQKMEVVGQLASGFAHDFRHILSVIIGNLELLMIRHAADADDKTALGRAMDAATHGVAVIQSMMHFVRKTPPNPRIVDLNDVINTTMLHQAVGSRIAAGAIACDIPHFGESRSNPIRVGAPQHRAERT